MQTYYTYTWSELLQLEDYFINTYNLGSVSSIWQVVSEYWIECHGMESNGVAAVAVACLPQWNSPLCGPPRGSGPLCSMRSGYGYDVLYWG